MQIIKYLGPKSEFYGKTLFELLLNLRNFGVGRVITRSSWKYPEPSYYVVKKVEPQMDPDNQWGEVLVDYVFRGHKQPRQLLTDGNYPDFWLVPKDEEHLYLNNSRKEEIRIYSQERKFPPLLERILQKEFGLQKPPKLPCAPVSIINTSTSRIAKEGEQPTHFFERTPPLRSWLLEGVKKI